MTLRTRILSRDLIVAFFTIVIAYGRASDFSKEGVLVGVNDGDRFDIVDECLVQAIPALFDVNDSIRSLFTRKFLQARQGFLEGGRYEERLFKVHVQSSDFLVWSSRLAIAENDDGSV